MKFFQARNLLLVLVALAAVTASGCGFVNGIRAKSALNDGARAYKAGDFRQAEEEFQRALNLDPTQENARMYLARSIERQYKPTGVNTPENDQKAQQALVAYREILQRDPNNDVAYSAITRLLGYTKSTDEQLQFVTQRANDESAPNEKRGEAFTFLASKQWRCSNEITEQPVNKQTVQRDGKALLEYKKPENEADFQRAEQCATQGLELAERAVQLSPNSEFAWAFKTNLLLEKAKLAQMDGNTQAKEEFERQAGEARQRNADLTEQKQRQKEEAERQKEEATAAR